MVRRLAAINRMEIPMPKPVKKPAKTRSLKSKSAPTTTAKSSQPAPAYSVIGKGGDAPSKQARVIAMLQSPAGTTIAAMMKATGWQQHSVRGFLAGVVRKKLKLKLESKKVDGKRIYRIDSESTRPRQVGRRPSAARPDSHAARERSVRHCRTGRRSTSRSRACAISTSGALRARWQTVFRRQAAPSPAAASSVPHAGVSAAGRSAR